MAYYNKATRPTIRLACLARCSKVNGGINILGLGIAGSLLAARLSRAGIKVSAFDPQKRYIKPCGEAVPAWFFQEKYLKYTHVKSKVSRYTVNVDGETIFDWDAGKNVWLIIDKEKLVNTLREIAIAEGASIEWKPGVHGKGYNVDARGPFSQGTKRTIPVYRIIAKTRSWDEDRVHIEFDSGKAGFYWIFPSGDNLVNVGGGFAYNPGLVAKLVHKYASVSLDIREILDKSASLITIHPEHRFFHKNTFYLGEAAGLIMPSTGEGIRPALLSAEKLFQALAKSENPHITYRNGLEEIVRESRLSYTLFRVILNKKPRSRAQLLSSLPEGFWRKYFSATLSSWKELVFSMLKTPMER